MGPVGDFLDYVVGKQISSIVGDSAYGHFFVCFRMTNSFCKTMKKKTSNPTDPGRRTNIDSCGNDGLISLKRGGTLRVHP